MPTSEVRIARDYNRGLLAPVRAAHVALAAIRAFIAPLATWSGEESRRAWARPLLWGLAAFIVLLPFDGALVQASRWLRANLGGDPRRELEALQQYGQFSVSVIVAVVIYLQDPPRRRQLLNWLAAWVLAAIVVYPMKLLVGRPRPRVGDGTIHADVFLGPFGAWPLGVRGDGEPRGVRHGWELWARIGSDLWSMPSSHTAYAVVMSVVLARVYPRLRGVFIFMACLVGFARMLFDAHYATDVAIGAAVGAAAARMAMTHRLGEHVAARLARRPSPVA